MRRMMKSSFLVSVCLLGLIVLSGCDKIEPGHVGIVVNNYGSQKGVEDYPVKTGRIFYNPWTQDLYVFPTFMQNKVWTKDIREDSPTDESIIINSSEGSQIVCDVGLSYTIEAEKVPLLFISFRKTIKEITDGYLRNQVRDIMTNNSSAYKAVELMSDKQQEYLNKCKEELQTKLQPYGFKIDTLSFVSAPNPDQKVKDSITLVIEATQKAIEAENKVKQIEAEARQEVARADGKAQAILKEATSQAEANKILAESITPDYIKYKMLEKWNGEAPRVIGGSDVGLLFNMEK
jgi:regulator of protease activity HflC (stomatin/prohibitin superfamily)